MVQNMTIFHVFRISSEYLRQASYGTKIRGQNDYLDHMNVDNPRGCSFAHLLQEKQSGKN
jgi:hypothetical protein